MTLYYAGWLVIPLILAGFSLGTMTGLLVGYRMGRRESKAPLWVDGHKVADVVRIEMSPVDWRARHSA